MAAGETVVATEARQTRPAPGWRWLVWLVVVAIWTVALLTTQPAVVAAELVPEPASFPSAKLLHVAAYLCITVLTGWLRLPSRRQWLMLLFPTLHAFTTEFLQQFVPQRTGSLLDVGIDHIGIVLGLALSWKWWGLVSANGRRQPAGAPSPPAG